MSTLQERNAAITLPEHSRAIVRKAIVSHPDWSAYRAATGENAASLGGTRCREIATRFRIDIEQLLATGEQQQVAAVREPAAAAPAATGDALAQLIALAVRPHIAELQSTAIDAAAVRDIVDAALAKRDDARTIRIIDSQTEAIRFEGTAHPMFERLLKTAQCRLADGSRINIWLSGPTASGKTHAAKQVAQALGLAFEAHGAMCMAHELVGFVDAGGTYRETGFRRAFEHGGVVLLDELDSWDAAASLALNGALANGEMQFPDRMVERHPDCIVIGAANTWGSGATAEYMGRNRLDAAFLSRFAVKLHWERDETFERSICGNPEFAERAQAARARAISMGVKINIDLRHMQAGAALIAGGMSPADAALMTYCAGLSQDQIDIIEQGA